MGCLKILTYPDPLLKKKAAAVTKIDGELRALARDMVETMYEGDGVGLAAPQVAVSKQMIVVSPNAKRGEERILLNPQIVKFSFEEATDVEGCLSVPGISVQVRRPLHIIFKALDLKGQTIEEEVSDFPARVIQHEIDHLNGVLIISHATVDERAAFESKIHQRL
jgi:peptide deformylase